LLTCVLPCLARYFIVFPVGISTNPQHAGPMFVMIVLYQFWTVGFAYAVAACVQNEQQAALINPSTSFLAAGPQASDH
jgi:hypothetical protein